MSEADSAEVLTVLVYSDDREVRERVIRYLGPRLGKSEPGLSYVECATEPALIRLMDGGGIDLAILDGEATPAGGMGIARQVKDELNPCPPIMVLIGRPQDAWLATWSRAEAVVQHPVNPVELAEAAAVVLKVRQPVSGIR
ncbi:MAG: hypothetical protein Q8P61_06360 [Candidatus Nanopelagicales bacterium]|nr:hypothetical protein [Candidatus Nanopelagicales bacterium]